MNEKNMIQLCPICETGKRDYLLDKHSIFCSHIGYLNDGKCSQFIPINRNKKKLKKVKF